MKMIKFLPLVLIVSSVAFAAGRSDSTARVGVKRGSQTGTRVMVTAADVQKAGNQSGATTVQDTVNESSVDGDSADCREAYRNCMDSFCLLEESQGERCACSDNIEAAKSKIQAVLDIQAEADKLFTDGVEREKLGAKADLVFGDNNTSTKVSGADFMSWLTGDDEDEDADVGEDVMLGDALYEQAVKYCADELKKCGGKADMESLLYSRMITQDCKNYDAYLKEQKANAESNKRVAESAVRKARLEMLDTTNKYNRGECLLAFRSCVADKGGCGTNFENCLDASLLKRRSNACENILDQCMAVRSDVQKDWNEESQKILEQAAKYADTNKRGTCLAKVQNCLEENCSTSTNAACLTDVNVAAGICPVITECDEMIPGFQSVINDKLGFLRTKFCENDIDKCLQDKCGVDFTKAECIGKKPYEIAALCPQNMFPSCKTADQYDIIVQSAILQMDYQMLQGCVNYFSEQLGKVCGTDMTCLSLVASATSFDKVPETESEAAQLRAQVVSDSDAAVDEFFKQFEQDKTVAACLDSQSGAASNKIKGKNSLGDSVFGTAKMLAKMSAEQRNIREMESRIAELSRTQDLEAAKKNCLNTYKPESPTNSKTNYSYIKSASFEPSLRNCHVCRIQQVCEEGGESKSSSALKAAAGGLSAGASAGTMINAGWGTAIGGVIGAVGAGALGFMSGDKKEFCQEIESCEDINM